MDLGELTLELRNLDEITLIELLGVNSEEIVDAFRDKINEEQIRLTRSLVDEQN